MFLYKRLQDNLLQREYNININSEIRTYVRIQEILNGTKTIYSIFLSKLNHLDRRCHGD